MKGLNTAAGKVRLISLGTIAPGAGDQGTRNRRFQSYLGTQGLFRGAEVTTVDELKEQVRAALFDALSRTYLKIARRSRSAINVG